MTNTRGPTDETFKVVTSVLCHLGFVEEATPGGGFCKYIGNGLKVWIDWRTKQYFIDRGICKLYKGFLVEGCAFMDELKQACGVQPQLVPFSELV